jgi:hypothetical protein
MLHLEQGWFHSFVSHLSLHKTSLTNPQYKTNTKVYFLQDDLKNKVLLGWNLIAPTNLKAIVAREFNLVYKSILS